MSGGLQVMLPHFLKVKVAIGITVYNDYKLIYSLLETIRYYTKDFPENDFAIVVIDDGSTEENKQKLRHVICQHQDWKPNLYLIENKENKGITKSWNYLTDFFNSEYTVLMNNDILVTRFWLNALIFFLENNDCSSASLPTWYCPPQFIGPIVENLDNYEIQIVDPNTKLPRRNQPINYVEDSHSRAGRVMCPAGMLFGFKTSRWREIGGFNENMRSFYNEIQFGTEWAKRGLCAYSLPFPYCYHVWGHTFNLNQEQLKPSETMQKDREEYIKLYGGDIHPNDDNNTHRRFMPNVGPNKIKYLLHDVVNNERCTKIEEYQETEEEAKKSAEVRRVPE